MLRRDRRARVRVYALSARELGSRAADLLSASPALSGGAHVRRNTSMTRPLLAEVRNTPGAG
jgi:hypothetical protein